MNNLILTSTSQDFSSFENLCRIQPQVQKIVLDCVSGDDMNFVKEMTDELYAAKSQVAKEAGLHLVEPLWHQIQQYRSEFMARVGDVDFCLCPGILRLMLKCHELLCLMDAPDSTLIEQSLTQNDSLWLFQKMYKTEGSLNQRVVEICRFYGQGSEKEWQELMSEQASVFCLFVCLIQKAGNTDFTKGMSALMLKHTGMEALLNVLRKEDFEIQVQKDGTYALSDLLRAWIFRLSQMTLKSQEKTSLDFDEMMIRYPQLKEYQIQFYLDHHEAGCYYTIEQFAKCCKVCHETGRCALNQLVKLGFYEVQKQGKKFVYTAR